MAELGLRFMGEDPSRVAKSIKTDRDGNLETRVIDRINTRNLIPDGAIMLSPGESKTIENTELFPLFNISGRITTNQSELRIRLAEYTAQSAVGYTTTLTPNMSNSRFFTKVVVGKSPRYRIELTNTSNADMTISHLAVNSCARVEIEDPLAEKEIAEYLRDYENPVLLEPGQEISVILRCFPHSVFAGRLSANTTLEITYRENVFSGTIAEPRKSLGIIATTSTRFVTDPITPRTKNIHFYVKNVGETSVNINQLLLYEVGAQGGGGGSLSVEDMEGKETSLTAEKDEDGKGVLRVVDAAPHAYDEGSDALKVVMMNGGSEPLQDEHRTMELAWNNSSLTGNELVINLNGNNRLLRGKKGFIVYQGMADGHSIFLRTRLGASGNFIDEYIVENGTGATGNNKKAKIPEELLPFADFSNSSFQNSTSQLIFKTPSGSLTGLRAYIVLL